MALPPDPLTRAPLDHPRPGGEMRSAAASAPTRSQILPMAGEWQELFSRPYFIPGIVGCLVIALLWMYLGERGAVFTVDYRGLPVGVPLYTMVLAACICLGGAYALYRMAGKPKAWWVMPVAAAFTGVVCFTSVMRALQSMFDIGADSGSARDSAPVVFFKMFFAAGLPEECMKAIPVLIGVAIGMHLMKNQRAGDGPLRQMAVVEPLDGIIIGTAAGFGFAFAETMFQYVPMVMVSHLDVLATLADKALTLKLPRSQELGALTLKIAAAFKSAPAEAREALVPAIRAAFRIIGAAMGEDRAALELQRAIAAHRGEGLELMIPRLLANLFGHAAYAGVFGYFIGLAAMKPGQRIKTLLIGLGVAAALHALWNATGGISAPLAFLATALAFSVLSLCIIKARKISPDRSQLVASQVIDRFALPRQPFRAPELAAGTASGPVPAPAPMAAPGAAAVVARAPQASVTWDDDSGLRMLEMGSARIPATVGARLYESHLPGVSAGRGDGIVAEVTANPNDLAVLGLKNLSDRTWTFVSPGRAERELAPGRSIKLEAGLQVRIGQAALHVR